MLLGAPLVFPMVAPSVTVAGAIGVVAIAVYQAMAAAPPRGTSSLDLPWALFLVQAMVAAVISPFPLISVSRLACLVYGSIVLRALIVGIRTRWDLGVAVWLYAVGGGLVGVGGLFGTVWPGFDDIHRKVAALGPIAYSLPQRLSGIPGAEGGFNANAMGGATLLFIPLLMMLFVRAVSRRSVLQAVVAAGALLPLLVTVTLTQSRTAWLALAVVIAAMLLVLARSALLTGLVVTAAVIALLTTGAIRTVIDPPPATPQSSGLIALDTRPHLWARAIQEIRRAPLTGIGLDAFRITGREVSPPFAGADPRDVHVHNVFLQTALDVGLPGLVAFVGLLLASTRMWLAVNRAGSRDDRFMALGVFGGLLGVTVFGLYDAVAMGTKLSLCIWWSLGLLVAVHQCVVLNRESHESFISV